jgi:hypothetical protein
MHGLFDLTITAGRHNHPSTDLAQQEHKCNVAQSTAIKIRKAFLNRRDPNI